MKKIGITMAACLTLSGLAYANSPTSKVGSDTYNNGKSTGDSQILPETYTKDGDGSGLGISQPNPGQMDTSNAPGDVDQGNMGETGASGAVGTATGTTGTMGTPGKHHKAKKGMRASTGTATSTATSTATDTQMR